MTRNVAITSVGCITTLGNNVSDIWRSLLMDCSGIDAITSFNAEAYTCNLGAEVKKFNKRSLPINGKNMLNTVNVLELKAIVEIIDNIGEDSKLDNEKGAIFLGNQIIHTDTETIQVTVNVCKSNGDLQFSMLGDKQKSIPPLSGVKLLPTVPSHFIAKVFNIHGEGCIQYNSETSGIMNLVLAAEQILHNNLDYAIVCSAFSPFNPYEFMLLCRLGMMKKDNPRLNQYQYLDSFNKQSGGTIYGEGAAAVLIESEESADKMGRKILGYIKGGDVSIYPGETYMDITADGFCRSIRNSLDKASYNTSEIDTVFTNACAYQPWDLSEWKAITKTWNLEKTRIINIKRNLGFSGCASGLIDCVIATKSLQSSELLPSVNKCPNISRVKKIMIQSGGLGGNHSSIIIGNNDEK